MAVAAANQPQNNALKHNRQMLLKHRSAVMRWLICNDVYIPSWLFKDERMKSEERTERPHTRTCKVSWMRPGVRIRSATLHFSFANSTKWK